MNRLAPGARTVTQEVPSGFRTRVPVVRDGKLVGIVARSDLVRALAHKLQEKPTASTIELETLNEALRRRRVETGS